MSRISLVLTLAMMAAAPAAVAQSLDELAEAVRDYWRQQFYPLRAAALDTALAVWGGVDALTM